MGEDILLFGDGEQKRDFNYVDDVVRAFLMAATSEAAVGEIYNLGAKPPTTLKDFLELLYEVAGRKPNYKLVPFPEERRKIDIGDFYTDYSLIESRLGWSPKTSLRDGLSHTVTYYRDNMEHYLS
jgi:nucleoside-diphosphate-sugar epimerase